MAHLSDDLFSEQFINKPSPTEAWISEWYNSLDDDDRATFDEYVNDPTKSAAALWRVCRKRGFPYSENPFREWVMARRGAF